MSFSHTISGRAVLNEAVTLTTVDVAVTSGFIIQFLISVGCSGSADGINQLAAFQKKKIIAALYYRSDQILRILTDMTYAHVYSCACFSVA